MLKNKQILIVGLGLIGGSYAKGLSNKGISVSAIDIDEEALRFAKENKYINNNNLSNQELIKNADLIIFGMYPKKIPEWITINQKYFKDSVILTDVSGTKVELLKEVREVLNSKYIYISHHPMAGKEKTGVHYSDDKIFEGANFIITPDKQTNGIDVIKELGETLKFKNIEILDPKSHDEVVGYLSQLTHVIAISLMNARDTDHMIKYTGDSFRDLTRIANINEKLWSELFFENKEVLINEIEQFTKSLNEIKETLINSDEEKLKELMKESTRRREKFNK